jgi:hypothetical protein
MTNTVKTQKFHAVPSTWIMASNQFVGSLTLTPSEVKELTSRLSIFWTVPGAFSLDVDWTDRFNRAGWTRVQYEGKARVAAELAEMMFTFYQDVNNDLILNED